MADSSSEFPNQLSNSDILHDSDIQPHLIDGALRLHDNSDVSEAYDNPAFSESSTDPTPEVQNGHAPNAKNGLTSGVKLPPPPSKQDVRNLNNNTKPNKTITHSPAPATTPTSTSGSSLPVVYDNRSGNNVVIQEPVVANQTDGSRRIQTHSIPERWRDLDRPLRQKRLKFLKAFGIIAIFFFFPSGIPACYYAFKAKTEFEEGIMRGNIDLAATYAKRAERLIILSGVLALVFGILCFALFERTMNPERYASWHPGGSITHSG